MNASPPMPVMFGSVTFSTAAIAIAASIALPPRFSTSRPVCDASGWLDATIAWLARAADRPACTPENQAPGIFCPPTVPRHPSVTAAVITCRMVLCSSFGSGLKTRPCRSSDRPNILPGPFHQRVAEILARPLDIFHQARDHLGIRFRDVLRFRSIGLEIVKRQLDVFPHALSGHAVATGRLQRLIRMRQMQLPPAAANRMELLSPVEIERVVRSRRVLCAAEYRPGGAAVDDLFGPDLGARKRRDGRQQIDRHRRHPRLRAFRDATRPARD